MNSAIMTALQNIQTTLDELSAKFPSNNENKPEMPEDGMPEEEITEEGLPEEAMPEEEMPEDDEEMNIRPRKKPMLKVSILAGKPSKSPF